jgi:hypothetical protein
MPTSCAHSVITDGHSATPLTCTYVVGLPGFEPGTS